MLYRRVMAILLLHRSSGMIPLEAGSVELYARDCGFAAEATILDGDECVKLLRNGDWLAAALCELQWWGTANPGSAHSSIPLSRQRFRSRLEDRKRSCTPA